MKKAFFIVLILVPTLAFAHAHLHSSKPLANSVIADAPHEVVLNFSEAIEPKFSKVEVISSDGKSMTSGGLEQSSTENNVAVIHLKSDLQPGKYAVKWKVVSTDSHKAQGQFEFTYKSK